MQIVQFSQKRYSLFLAAQNLHCGFGKLEFDELSIMLAAVFEEVGHDHLCFLRNGIAMLLVVFEQRTRCLPLD